MINLILPTSLSALLFVLGKLAAEQPEPTAEAQPSCTQEMTNEKKNEKEPEKKEKADTNEPSSSKKEESSPKEEKDSKPEKDAKEEKEDSSKEESPPRIGNFSLPTSQQPAALFGFGGNIIEKGEIQLYFFADDFVGKKRIVSDLIPGVLFGITDDWSIFFNTPVTPLMKNDKDQSRGLEDWFVQLEYAFYNKSTYCYQDQATVVANITFPTGSIRKNPNTGFGAPSIFLGTTYYRTMVDWVLFTAYGGVLTFSEHRTKYGDQFLYQWGVSRYVPSPKGWIFAWMLELDGQYNKKDRIRGKIDPDSGGNVVYLTPSIWASSKVFLFQFGVSIPLNQNFFGKQNKFDYALNLNMAYSFY